MSRAIRPHGLQFLTLCAVLSLATTAVGAPPESGEKKESKAPAGKDSADREAALSKMLSGATLEGSYTLSGPGAEGSKLAREKYTLGEVKKLAGDVWLFPARIEYGGKDVTLPIPLPIRWAGDTPIVVVDNVTLPGFGTVSARVLFFDGHYAGYWKHGDHSGNLFGEIRSAGEKPGADKESKDSKDTDAPSGGNSPAEKKPKQ
jgi:hypothetical protein